MSRAGGLRWPFRIVSFPVPFSGGVLAGAWLNWASKPLDLRVSAAGTRAERRRTNVGKGVVLCVALCAVTILDWRPTRGGVGPNGSEFQVNGSTTFTSRRPSVSQFPTGGFFVVWEQTNPYPSGDDIVGRQFTPDGASVIGDVLVSTYASDRQFGPRIASETLRRPIAVWNSDSYFYKHEGVFGTQIAHEPPTEFQVVETFNTHYGAKPDVAMAPSGDFIVIWQALSDGSYEGVFGQRFDSLGFKTGTRIQVNTETLFSQGSAAVAADDSGGFVVVWMSEDGGFYGVFGRRFDSAGAPMMSDFQVNEQTLGSQGAPKIAVGPGGDMLVTWTSDGQDGSCTGVFGRHFDPSFTPTGTEFQMNTFTTGCQRNPDVAVSKSGEFVVVWDSPDQDGSCTGIFGRRVDSTGSPRGGEFQVNSHTRGCQAYPSVAPHADDGFVVVWQGRPGPYYPLIGGQMLFDRAPEVTIPVTSGTLDCSAPGVSTPTITWDPDGYDLFRVTIGWDRDAPGAAVNSGSAMLKTTSWSVPVKKWSKACLKSAALDPNEPTLYVQVLGVDRDLPSRDPARKRLSAVVQVRATK